MIKGRKIKVFYFFLIIFLVIMPSAVARFTSKNSFTGSLNIYNHPGGSKDLGSKILDSYGGKSSIKNKTKPDFNKVATTKEGVFMAEDDYGESYYYRGVADNWLSFAGFYWRIICINGDGSIRLIYSGTKDNHTGKGPFIGNTAYNYSDSSESYLKYENSNLKNYIDRWYESKLKGKPEEKFLADSTFCNDMSYVGADSLGNIYYNYHTRITKTKKPTLKCIRKQDVLTQSNGKLRYRIAIINGDETAFAGGTSDKGNTKYYLSADDLYYALNASAKLYNNWLGCGVLNNGIIGGTILKPEFGVRPVINLKPEVIIASGDGTESNPYVIK